MRLDHLLSKELWRSSGCPGGRHRGECPWSAAHGWNIDIGIQADGSGSVRRSSGWLERPGSEGWVRARCWVLRDRTGPGCSSSFGEVGALVREGSRSGLRRCRCSCWWGWGFWSSVENYIVDASILEAAFGLFHIGESPGGALRGGCLAYSLVNFFRHFGVGDEFDRTHVISSF